MGFGCVLTDVGTGVGMTSSKHGPDAIRIGVAADEPIRIAGLGQHFRSAWRRMANMSWFR